jgi:hypothetical protein
LARSNSSSASRLLSALSNSHNRDSYLHPPLLVDLPLILASSSFSSAELRLLELVLWLRLATPGYSLGTRSRTGGVSRYPVLGSSRGFGASSRSSKQRQQGSSFRDRRQGSALSSSNHLATLPSTLSARGQAA